MKKHFTLALISIFFMACNTKINPNKEVTVKDIYTIEIAGNMAEIGDLLEEASLQYGNNFKEIYIVVIDNEKSYIDYKFQEAGKKPGLESYAQETLPRYQSSINYKLINSENTKINELNAKIFEITATVKGVDTYYYIGVIEGKTHYYRVINWTLLNNKDAQRENMIKMTQSFKEL